MFNSVAKYLWGANDGEEENQFGYTEGSSEQDLHPVKVKEINHPEDDDWVLVDTVDKENCSQTSSPHHHALPHHHSNHPHHHHHHSHQSSPQDPVAVGSGACDIELLDDAASLAHHLAVQSADKPSSSGGQVFVPDNNDSRLPNVHHLELDSGDSSDTEENGLRPSSPESVFSACSGRSHATYRPKGQASEPWVVAPPPCFTGSQLGSSEPLASSPLENLLIEHPSMSVYYSVPSHTLPPTHPLFSLPHIADPSADKEAGQASDIESVGRTAEHTNDDLNNATARLAEAPAASRLTSVQVQRRGVHPRHAALHSIQLTPEKLEQKTRIAQRHQVSQSQKSLSKKDCYRSNMVRTYSASSKRSNRRDKLVRPSGCKSSRNSQRVH